MNVPPLLAVDVLGDGSPITIGLAIGVMVVGIAWGEARVQISALREWKAEATEQLKSQATEMATVKATASTQGQQIANIISLLTELRADVKTLLTRRTDP